MPDGPTIADTSCLIALESIDRLGVLEQLYGQISIPTAVAMEWGSSVPHWITILSVQNLPLVLSMRDRLGEGESETIACALETNAKRIILDDKRARQVAQRFDLPLTGTVGVILRAKEHNILSAVGPVLNELGRVGFSLSDHLLAEALRLASE